MCAVKKTVLLDTWVSKGGLGFLQKNRTLLIEKIPKKMNGCPLRVQVAHFPLYVVFQKKDKLLEDVPSFTGLDIDMIHTAAEIMNMTLKLVPLYDIYSWGRLTELGLD